MSHLTLKDWQNVLNIQDACNIIPIIKMMAEVQDRILQDCPNSTLERNEHPINVLYTSKLVHLTRSEDIDKFNTAYLIACDKVDNWKD